MHVMIHSQVMIKIMVKKQNSPRSLLTLLDLDFLCN